MAIHPANWNVVILGQWNKAIFTPKWIARNLFQLESEEMVMVEVALSEFLPHKVVVQDLTVVVPTGKLIIEPKVAGYRTLERACTIAGRAFDRLPETPVTAAGLNVRYKIDDLSLETTEKLMVPLDTRLSDRGYEIKSKELRRTLAFEHGVVNFRLTTPDEGPSEIEFNFHRESPQPNELAQWLSTPIGRIRDRVENIGQTLSLNLVEDQADAESN